jgi:hypothetical protein
MPKTPEKRKKGIGKLTDEAESHKVCLVRSAKLAKLTEVPLVVTPEAASYACALTASSKVTSTPLSLSTPSSNLSSAFAAESSAEIMKSPSSVVKKKAEYIDFWDSARPRQNVSSTSKMLLICLFINRVRSLSLSGNITRVLS